MLWDEYLSHISGRLIRVSCSVSILLLVPVSSPSVGFVSEPSGCALDEMSPWTQGLNYSHSFTSQGKGAVSGAEQSTARVLWLRLERQPQQKRNHVFFVFCFCFLMVASDQNFKINKQKKYPQKTNALLDYLFILFPDYNLHKYTIPSLRKYV